MRVIGRMLLVCLAVGSVAAGDATASETVAYGAGGIAVVGIDGRGFRVVTPPGWTDFAPMLSPDGHRLAFHAATRRGKVGYWLMDLDGSHRHPFRSSVVGSGQVSSWRWLGDSRRCAFIVTRSASVGLYVGDVETGRSRLILRRKIEPAAPSWWVDVIGGSRRSLLALFSGGGAADTRLTVVDHDGHRVWNRAASAATWSRDGKRIALSQDGSHWAIIDRHGKALGSFTGSAPTWSPDGEHVAFFRGAPPRSLWIGRYDGRGLRRLARWQSPATTIWMTSWSPDGRLGYEVVTVRTSTRRQFVVAHADGRVRGYGDIGMSPVAWVSAAELVGLRTETYPEQVVVRSLRSGRTTVLMRVKRGDRAQLQSIAVTPDGRNVIALFARF